MFVSRCEVNLRVSIQRESCVTGANARFSSRAGSGPASDALRTNRSRSGPAFCPGSTGSHREAGASVASSATLRGPVRRS